MSTVFSTSESASVASKATAMDESAAGAPATLGLATENPAENLAKVCEFDVSATDESKAVKDIVRSDEVKNVKEVESRDVGTNVDISTKREEGKNKRNRFTYIPKTDEDKAKYPGFPDLTGLTKDQVCEAVHVFWKRRNVANRNARKKAQRLAKRIAKEQQLAAASEAAPEDQAPKNQISESQTVDEATKRKASPSTSEEPEPKKVDDKDVPDTQELEACAEAVKSDND